MSSIQSVSSGAGTGEQLRVIKRDGTLQEVEFDKISSRLRKLSEETPCELPSLSHINVNLVSQKVITQIYDKIPTSQLDELAALVSMGMITIHPQYGDLAGRIAVSNHQKQTTPNDPFLILRTLAEHIDDNGKSAPVIDPKLVEIAEEHREDILSVFSPERDYLIDYFGFKTLERAYLLKSRGKVIETPQSMWLRVALGIHRENIGDVLATYRDLSLKFYTHATPTLFNAGTLFPQMSSCFLLSMKDDSIKGIYETLGECAMISKWGGGIGLHIHNIRATGSYIRGTSGTSNGIVPMLRVFNQTARYCDQGGGRRKGSFAIYLEPWHADVEDFLRLKINHGNEEERARDLFYAMWIPDLFMKRVKENKQWTLFCPDRAPGLADVWGDAFQKLYEDYESEWETRGGRQVSAQKLWFQILQSQIETGTPYLLYKDACNSKSNQQNLGTIKSSNLCTEIIEYSSPEETAVCNLASMNLQSFLLPVSSTSTSSSTSSGSGSGSAVGGLFGSDYDFDFELFRAKVFQVVRNLDKVIDGNFYPTEATSRSNFRHRPIGIGVQGLSDVFSRLRIAYDSPEASYLNKKIFAHMYHAAVSSSADLARSRGKYSSFEGSPASHGKLQYDLWGVNPREEHPELDWDALNKLSAIGLRNSLLIAPMPTASTSQILGNNESFEPFTTNIFTRRTIAGEFIIVNKYLVEELTELGLWNEEMKTRIVAARGSVQGILSIPEEVRRRYKTVWELSQKTLIDLAAERAPYICQSQSLNLYMGEPTFKKLSSMAFYAWEKGLKTGQYYLRTRPVADAQQFTVDPSSLSGKSKSLFSTDMTQTNTIEREETTGTGSSLEDALCEMCSA
jgi:ribonucleoside-diphosphate reductase alpha subunit